MKSTILKNAAAISREFAKEGATVIIINKNNPNDATELANQITANGGSAMTITCDILDSNATCSYIYLILPIILFIGSYESAGVKLEYGWLSAAL